MSPHNHILGTFDEALTSLRNNVLMMSSLTERSLDRAITGLLQRDDDLCAIVFDVCGIAASPAIRESVHEAGYGFGV